MRLTPNEQQFVTGEARTTGRGTAGQRAERRALRPVFLGLMLALMLAALDSTIVATALPTIVGELGDLAQLAFVVTAYLLAATIAGPLFGGLSDQLGRKRVFQAAIALFLLGALLSGAATGITQLLAFRFVQGAGAGGLLALTQTVIADLVSPRERGRYAGYIGTVFGVASILGPVLGGLFVDQGLWRLVFWINVPLALFALVVLHRLLHLPRATPAHRRVDWAGSGLLVAGVGAVLLALALGGRVLPWFAPAWLALMGLGIAALAGLVVVERRAEHPLLPPALFRNRVFVVGSSLGLVTGMAMFTVIVFTPLYLQTVTGVSATSSGLLLISLLVGMVTGTVSSGRAIVRWGRYKVFPVVGSSFMVAGLLGLASLHPDDGLARVGVSLVAVGLGLGLIVQVVVLAVQNAVERRHLGSATSLAQFFRTLGSTTGVTVAGVILQARVSGELAVDVVNGTLPAGTRVQQLLNSPAAIAALPGPVRSVVEGALADGITFLFALAVPMAAVAFVLALLLPELELRRDRD
jgi:EmrB/QacA subfamily drug resistance transporter